MKYLLALLLTACAAFGQTKTVTKKDDGTNRVTGDLKFPTGKTLTIEAGATLNATGATLIGIGGGGGSGDVTSAGDNTFTGTNSFSDGKLRLQITDAATLGLTAPVEFSSRTENGLLLTRFASPQVGTATYSFPVNFIQADGMLLESGFSAGFFGDLSIFGGEPLIGLVSIATGANPLVTTDTAHGFSAGQTIWLQGLVGYTPDINGQRVVLAVSSPTEFTLDGVTVTVAGTQGSVNARSLGIGRPTGEIINCRTGDITGEWTFTGTPRISSASPVLAIGNPTVDGGLSLATSEDVAQTDWSYTAFGLNMQVDPSGLVAPASGAGDTGWGMVLEKNYLDSEGALADEFYLTNLGSRRILSGAISQSAAATIVSVVAGGSGVASLVTISAPEVTTNYLRAGMRIVFPELTTGVNINTTTKYKVLSVVSPTSFRLASDLGVAIENATAAGGIMNRGGWGGVGISVPAQIVVGQAGQVSPYEYNATGGVGAALHVGNNVPGFSGRLVLNNYEGSRSYIDLAGVDPNDQFWRIGRSYLADANHNLFVQNAFIGGVPFQISAVTNNIAIGYASYQAAATALDVNGTVTATAFSGSGAATLGATTTTTLAASGAISSTFNQTQSTAQARFSGTLLGAGTGASATNSWPAIYHAPSSITAPSNWSTGANNGTVYGAVEVAGFTGNFLDLKISGTSASKLIIASTGSITMDVNGSGTYTSGGGSSSGFRWGSRGNMGAYLDGKFQLQNNTAGAGMLFDVTTDGTIKIRTRADGADGSLTALNITASGITASAAAAPTIASAGTIAPTKAITFISGTTTVSTVTAPSPISAGGGQITLIPTGIFLTDTAGNIALASTAVVSRALILTYDTATAKWYPSY